MLQVEQIDCYYFHETLSLIPFGVAAIVKARLLKKKKKIFHLQVVNILMRKQICQKCILIIADRGLFLREGPPVRVSHSEVKPMF